MKTTRPYSGDSAERCYNVFSAIIALLFLTGLSTAGYAQVNAYATVTGISVKTLTVTNVNTTYHTFTPGNEVIVMQMQDSVIGTNTANDASFGSLSAIKNAGLYEVATISSVTTVSGVPTALVLTTALKKTYSFGGKSRVQVISFRSYGTNATISSAISPLAWDGNIGGVVAIQVTGTLTLSSSVTANGVGFRGGAVSNSYESGCEPDVYIDNSANYAWKGEGIYANASGSGFLNGRGRIVTGGGGGSDDNGGGGGGGNFTAGGDGGPGWTCTTTATASGGLGGISLSGYSTGTRIYMGGGGGGGQQNNALGSAGGAGGGIIIIRANTLATSCSGTLTISANGAAAATSGNDGAGGGGAGGTIVLQLNAFSVPAACPLTLQSNGGNGGNVTNTNAHGGGGGGGQGAIYSSIPLASVPRVTAGTASGTGGLNSSSAGASSAGSGSGSANAGVTGTAMTALATTLTTFMAMKRDREVLINWNTVGESPNQLYNVQRSANGVSFTTIGTVNGTGGSNYTFTDRSIVPGMRYYRLEVADPFGRSNYSSTVAVNMDALQTTTLVAYPNPARGQFFIQVNGGSGDKYTLVITDLAGHPVYYNTYGAANNILSVSPGSILSPGTYLVKLTGSNNHTQFGKIMIQ